MNTNLLNSASKSKMNELSIQNNLKPVKLMKGLTFFYELLLIYLVEK